MMTTKSLMKVIKMIKADVVIDKSIDVEVLENLVAELEVDNNLPILKECEECE